ncbi:hypothetical protein E0H86_03785 [Acinetobacter sp. ANC 4635]|uniref:hypothetical protein n=1 Tax=Acinetobacter sp. ANC 4635 TaxID=2529846 RepID=UPI00103FD012|nr:hypothetical protein [Acinetobacter sp. ANC 4635]TCB32589.1 hypothetical protein E0H86_03785 [Acinetobacter sp. ANC 4635]
MKKFKDIAYVLAEKITNRYHDYNGFWGLGVLYTDCLIENICEIELDILKQISNIKNHRSRRLLSKLSELLNFYLDKNNLDLEQLQSAKIIIQYDLHHLISQRQAMYGDYYRVEVKLVAISGREYKQERDGYCFPHLVWCDEKNNLLNITYNTDQFLKSYFYNR